MSFQVVKKIVVTAALLCLFPSIGFGAEIQFTTESSGDLKFTACWLTPEMGVSPLGGLPDAEDIISAARAGYTMFYNGTGLGRGVGALAVWVENAGDSEQQILPPPGKARLTEEGGRQGMALLVVVPHSAITDESAQKDLVSRTVRIPPRSTVPLFFLFEGPSSASETVSLDLGVVRSTGAKVFTSKVVLSRQMRGILLAYEERVRGKAYAEKGQYDQAIRHYDAALSLYPKNLAFLINRGAARINSGQLSLGAEDCRKVIEIFGSSGSGDSEYLEKAYINLGLCEQIQGNVEAALEAYNNAAAANKKSASALLEIAELQQGKGRLVEARRALTEARSRDPGNVRLREMAGKLDAECTARAKELIRQALEHADNGMTDEAVRACRSAVELTPEDQDILYDAAEIFRSTGHYDFAITGLKDLVSRDPSMPLYHAALAMVYKAKGMLQEAKTEAAIASKLNRTAPTGSLILALQYMRSGCAEFAVSEFQNALRYLPNSGELHAELAMAYEESGKDREAAAEYAKALKLSPKSTFIHVNYGIYFHRKRNFVSALRHYELARQYRDKAKPKVFGRVVKLEIPQVSVDQLNELIGKARQREEP